MRFVLLILLSISFFLLIAFPLTLYGLLTKNIKPLYEAYRVFIRFGLKVAGVKLTVKGMENIPEPPCIFMPNHLSYLDGPILAVTTPYLLRAMVKKSVFKLPLIGTGMTLAEFVKVDRKNVRAAARAVDEVISKLRKGLSFMIFPEGTRSPDGKLQKFKRGGFIIAIRSGVKIVPVAIKGAYEVMPRHRFYIKPGKIEIVYLPPVDAKKYNEKEVGLLAEEVRRRIMDELKK